MSYEIFDPNGPSASSGDTPSSSLDRVVFDAVPSSTHGNPADATQYPVEEGASLTDHVQPQPRPLSFVGVLSNVPISPLDHLRRSSTYAQDAYEQLKRWRALGTPLSVIAGDDSYDSMILLDVERGHDHQKGRAVHLSITMREVAFATSQTVDAPEPVATRSKSTKAKGQKTTKAATVEQDRSGLAILADVFGG